MEKSERRKALDGSTRMDASVEVVVRSSPDSWRWSVVEDAIDELRTMRLKRVARGSRNAEVSSRRRSRGCYGRGNRVASPTRSSSLPCSSSRLVHSARPPSSPIHPSSSVFSASHPSRAASIAPSTRREIATWWLPSPCRSSSGGLAFGGKGGSRRGRRIRREERAGAASFVGVVRQCPRETAAPAGKAVQMVGRGGG